MKKSNEHDGFGFLFAAGTALVSPMHEVITRKPLYRTGTLPERRSPLRRLTVRLADALERWRQYRVQRRSLALLSDRLLQDIGLTRADVEAELREPIWR